MNPIALLALILAMLSLATAFAWDMHRNGMPARTIAAVIALALVPMAGAVVLS